MNRGLQKLSYPLGWLIYGMSYGFHTVNIYGHTPSGCALNLAVF